MGLLVSNPQSIDWALSIGAGAVAALAALIPLQRLIRHRRGRWQLINIKSEFTEEHHIPDDLPIPREHVDRARKGDFSVDEAMQWIENFVKESPRHKRFAEYRSVLNKLEIYRQVASKMGKGMWQDVDSLAQRLSEMDPLDPSASVARGRAMRELGNFAGAIRCYQKALELTPFHSMAFPEMAATCRVIGQPGRFRNALDKARRELGDTHPLTIEGRIQLGELVRVYADPTDPATLAHIPRDQYLQSVQMRLDEMNLDRSGFLRVGMSLLDGDLPELAGGLARRCEQQLGRSSQSLLLQAMVQHYHHRLDKAEAGVRKSLEQEDTAQARLELGRILQAKARRDPDPAFNQRFIEESRQNLRLAVDRDPNLVEAIGLLVEPAWSDGVEGLANALRPIAAAYPEAWGPWRVLGDAYATEGRHNDAIKCYRNGLAIADVDSLLLPCLNSMEEAGLLKEMHRLSKQIRHIEQREPQLRWKVAQSFFQRQEFDAARKVLQGLVDDEDVAPPLRQRADDILDELDSIERKKHLKK